MYLYVIHVVHILIEIKKIKKVLTWNVQMLYFLLKHPVVFHFPLLFYNSTSYSLSSAGSLLSVLTFFCLCTCLFRPSIIKFWYYIRERFTLLFDTGHVFFQNFTSAVWYLCSISRISFWSTLLCSISPSFFIIQLLIHYLQLVVFYQCWHSFVSVLVCSDHQSLSSDIISGRDLHSFLTLDTFSFRILLQLYDIYVPFQECWSHCHYSVATSIAILSFTVNHCSWFQTRYLTTFRV